MNNVEILTRMKEILMDRGWCRGSFKNEDGTVCLMGAITRTELLREMYTSRPYSTINLLEEPLDALREQMGEDSVLRWNDKAGRTFNEVIDLLDITILAEKEKLV